MKSPPVAARPAHVTATPVVVARIVAIGMAVGKSAPERHEHRRRQDRRDQRYPVEVGLTSNMPVQHSYHQENGDEPYHNGSYDPKGRTPPGQQFAYKSYQRRN